MFQWATNQIDKISQTVAPPPTDAAGRFSYAITRLDENTAMGCIAEIDPIGTVVNQSRGWFPIHMACQYSMIRLIRLLMSQPGVSIQQPDYAGCTPLHHACMSTQRATGLEVVKILLNEYSADPCAKNSQGKTPYDVATIDSIRQHLLPIQLQRETQYALDNGGQGLPPGIDFGGLKINRSNMAPPPQFGGVGVAAAPPGGTAGLMTASPSQSRYPQTPCLPSTNMAPPGQYQQVQQPAPVAQPIARAPARTPGRNSTAERSQSVGATPKTYSRSGGSSLAVYSKYKADGFHSSSSDVSLAKKYGNVGGNSGSAVRSPPSSGNAPVSGNGALVASGPNPFSRAGNLGGSSRYAAYGQAAPAPVSGPIHTGMGYGYPTAGAAAQMAPKYFTPGATNTPSSSTNGPTSPFMPPPPYSGATAAEMKPAAASPLVTASAPIANSPFSTPQSDAVIPAVSNLFESPPKTSDTTEAAFGITTPATSTITADEQRQQTNSETKEVQPSTDLGDEYNTKDTGSDWVETTDPTSGKTYYFNSKTNETSWDNPNATTSVEETTTTRAATSEKDTNGDSDWSETLDPSSGKSYYYNNKTGETSWEKPPGTTVDDAHGATATKDNGRSQGTQWVEATDPSSGSKYFYNPATGETSWDRPFALDSGGKSVSPDNNTPIENTERDADTTNDAVYDDMLSDQKEEEEKAEDDSSAGVESPREQTKEETDSSEVVDEKQSEAVEEESSALTKADDEILAETATAQDSSIMGRETATGTKIEDSNLNALLDGWIEAIDPSSGKVYYFNAGTNITSWEQPVADSGTSNEGEATTTEIVEEIQNEAVKEVSSAIVTILKSEDETPAETATAQGSSITGTETEIEESSSNILLDGWIEATDPSSGKVYYFNADTNITSWERPVADIGATGEGEAKPVADSSKKNVNAEVTEESTSDTAVVEDLADGWEELQDPSTGRIYYFNKETQVTSWKKPASTSSESAMTIKIAPSSEQENEWVETLDPSSGNYYYYNAKTGETSWEMSDSLKVQEDSLVTTATETEKMDANTVESKPTTSEDIFAQTAVDPSMKSGQTAEDKPQSSPLSRGHERRLSAEEMFASPPGVIQNNGTPGASTSVSSAAATQGSAVSSGGLSTLISVVTTAEDLFGSNAAESTPGKILDSTTAADLFSANAAESTPAKIPDSTTAADLFSANAAESTPTRTSDSGTAEDLFSAITADTCHAKTPDFTKTNASNDVTAEDSNEADDGDMTDIPLTPASESLIKPASSLPIIPNTTEAMSAPAGKGDLFAAIGMPPPPFQSKR